MPLRFFVIWTFTGIQLNWKSWRQYASWVCSRCWKTHCWISSTWHSSDQRLRLCGITPTQNEWIEKPGSFNSKIHVSDQFDFQQLDAAGRLIVCTERFFPTWRRSSTQTAQVNIAAVRFAPISSWTGIFVLTFLAFILAQFCNAFLIRFSEFRHLITLEFAWPVFSKITVAESNGCCVFIRPSCVGATPVPKGFHHMSNFNLLNWSRILDNAPVGRMSRQHSWCGFFVLIE